MSKQSFGVLDTTAAPVPDDEYGKVARTLIQGAAHSCFCMLFIVDPNPITDSELLIDQLLRDLAAAAWRGVDTRLLIGGSRSNGRILDSTLLARAHANKLGTPCRLVSASELRSNHSKLMIADNLCLIGSHNWSAGALGGQWQDSVILEDNALAAYFSSRFIDHWEQAKQEGFDVPR